MTLYKKYLEESQDLFSVTQIFCPGIHIRWSFVEETDLSEKRNSLNEMLMFIWNLVSMPKIKTTLLQYVFKHSPHRNFRSPDTVNKVITKIRGYPLTNLNDEPDVMIFFLGLIFSILGRVKKEWCSTQSFQNALAESRLPNVNATWLTDWL